MSDIKVNLNLNVRGLAPSSTLAINEKSNALKATGMEIFKLGLGQSPFPVPERVVKSLEENAFQKDYLPVKGLHDLRVAVSDHNNERFGIKTSYEDILIGPGSKELLFILQLVYYGDLIIPSPGWVSYSPQARIIGRNVHWIHTSYENDWLMTPEQLEWHCRVDPTRPRILILNYPSNPSGKSYPPEKLKELAEVARKYNVVVISDEIYGLLHHDGEHQSISSYYPEGTIISSGLSKWCGAGGWRLGTFSFPKSLDWLLDAMSIVASETFTSTAAPIQYAAITAFKGGEDIFEYLRHSRRILKQISQYILNMLYELQIKVAKPDGAFYLFPDFGNYRGELNKKGIYTSVELSEVILNETGVATLPGFDFGRNPEELTMRIAYVNFDGKNALERSIIDYKDKDLDNEFVEIHCSRTVEAFSRLIDWFKKLH